MSDSEREESSESSGSEPDTKRQKTDPYEAPSRSSLGFAHQDSEDEQKPENSEHTYNAPQPRPLRYQEGCPPARLSQSSSPDEDYQPSFDSKDEKSSDESSSGKITLDTSKYGNSAMRMMNKMGYKAGKGLGKHETGRTEPIQTSTQKGRRGLGHIAPQLGTIPKDFKWTPDDSKPEAKEDVVWMPTPPNEDVTADELEDWLIKGPKKLVIEDETDFCQESILKGILSAKTVFDKFDGEEMRNARSHSNPYEKIGSLFFLNRAAVKMANIDAICNFMFTEPKDRAEQPVVKKDDLLYFADVCAGPGGFSEYILYRKRWKAKGFGFTLRGSNDFKLSDFYAGPPDTFSPYYGPKDNGDIFDPENLSALKAHVLKQTDDKGVHFLMADGGAMTIVGAHKFCTGGRCKGHYHHTVDRQTECGKTTRQMGRRHQERRRQSMVPYSEKPGEMEGHGRGVYPAVDEYTLLKIEEEGGQGFSVDGQENLQEILSKQLYLCQCLAALMLVRTDGHFVVKLFDIFTPFSVSLVYLMYRSFDEVSIHKPVTSRPANSERYLICKRKRSGSDVIERHLFSVNQYLWDHRHDEEDIVSLVPLSNLRKDNEFCNYVYNSNCVLGVKQIKHLLKIKQFCEDKTLRDESQTAMREECLKLWQLPDEVRKKPESLSHDHTLNVIISLMRNPPRDASNLQVFKTNLRAKPALLETFADIKKNFKGIYDWYFEFLTNSKENQECRFFLGTGSCQAFELKDRVWQSVNNLNLPAKTLIYGEIVREYSGEGGKQQHIRAFHVIDAVCLGGVDVSYKVLTDRLQNCEIFCRAISKSCDPMSMPIRCKKLYRLKDFNNSMHQLGFRKMKRGYDALTLDIRCRTESRQWFHVVSSIVFLQEIKSPWESAMSRKAGTRYFFKVISNDKNEYKCVDSTHELPDEACMNALETLENRLEWYWEPASAVYNGTECAGKPGVKRREMEDHIKSKLMKQ